MRLRRFRFPAVGLLVLIDVCSSQAGMPAPLPTSWQEVLRLRETPFLRLQTISFFLAGLLLCAGAVQLLWPPNRKTPRKPRRGRAGRRRMQP
jgi:hypothetical protein